MNAYQILSLIFFITVMEFYLKLIIQKAKSSEFINDID